MNEIFLLKHEDGCISCYFIDSGCLKYDGVLQDMDAVLDMYKGYRFFGIFIYAKDIAGAPILMPEEVTN